MKVISIESNNTDDFENVIQEMPAFVKLFSPNCSHCTSMAPAWDALKDDDSIKNLDFALVAINSNAVGEMKCPGVKSFNGVPTMREIKKGTGEAGKEYSGSRTKEAMADFIKKTFNKRSSSLKNTKKGTLTKRKTKGGQSGGKRRRRKSTRKGRKTTRKGRKTTRKGRRYTRKY
jgi:hypothetical protein